MTDVKETKKEEVKKNGKKEKKESKSLINGKTKKTITKYAKKAGQGVISIVVGGLSVGLGIWLAKQVPPVFGNGENLEDVL